MKYIYLIRHGRQASKQCNVDVELDEIGRKQAVYLGKRLQNYGIEKLYSSNLIRARQTAEIINQFLQVEHDIIPAFHEIDFGGLTGKSDEQIREEYAEFREERALHKSDLPYPDGGESGKDVIERVLPEMQKICQAKENQVAIVTHGGVIRALLAYFLQTDLKNKLKFGIDLENTSVTQLIYDKGRNMFFLERFNDYAHIEAYPELLRSSWKTSLEKA